MPVVQVVMPLHTHPDTALARSERQARDELGVDHVVRVDIVDEIQNRCLVTHWRSASEPAEPPESE